jgi:hypothetical protein
MNHTLPPLANECILSDVDRCALFAHSTLLVFHLYYKGQYVTNVNYILNLIDYTVLSLLTVTRSTIILPVSVDILRSGNDELYLLACVAVQSGSSTYCLNFHGPR